MASNYIVLNSQFKPFSYAEMIQPVAMATEAHQNVEGQLSELSSKSNMWENLANEQTDPTAYKMYKTYADDLKSQATTLSKEGLNPVTRQSMLNMKERYSKEITPIENAYNRRLEDVKAQQDIMNKDSSYIFDRTAGTTSLDDYLKNPNIGYRGLSVNEVYSTAARDFAETAKKMQKEGKWRTALGGQYWEQVMQSGATANEIAALIAGDENAPQELKDLYNNTLESYTSRGNWDQKGREAIESVINRAATYGIGEVQTKMVQNQGYLNPLQQQQRTLNDSKIKALQNPQPQEGENRLPYRAVPRTTINTEKRTTRMQKDIDYLSQIAINPSVLQRSTTTNPNLKPSQNIARNRLSSPYTGFNTPVYDSGKDQIDHIIARYPELSLSFTINEKNGKIEVGKDFIESIGKLNDDIKTSAVRDQEYILNYTDNKLVNDVIKQNTNVSGRMGNDVPLYEYDGRKISDKRLPKRDYENINFETGFISFDPNINKVIYNYTDKDNKIKSLVVDTEVLDDPGRTLYSIQNNIDKAKKNSDPIDMNRYVNQLMGMLDGKFNTLAKVQSNTDSKINDIILNDNE